MQRHGNRAIFCPTNKSSRQMTHSPLSSVNVSSEKNKIKLIKNYI